MSSHDPTADYANGSAAGADIRAFTASAAKASAESREWPCPRKYPSYSPNVISSGYAPAHIN